MENKIRKSLLFVLGTILLIPISFSFLGCGKQSDMETTIAGEITEESITTETMVTETIIKETPIDKTTTEEAKILETINPDDIYTYKNLRRMADEVSFNFIKKEEVLMEVKGKYVGAPAQGLTLLIDDSVEGNPSCIIWENGIRQQWGRAGGNPEDLIIMYNNNNAESHAQIVDWALTNRPDGWIMNYAWQIENDIIAKKARDEGIFLVTLRMAAKGCPFMGSDSVSDGILAGQWVVNYINKTIGGWDKVDLVVTSYSTTNDSDAEQRSLRPIDELKAAFGVSADYDKNVTRIEGSKIVLMNCGENAEKSKVAMTDILSANPNAKIIVGFEINEEGIKGIIDAAKALNRWNPDNYCLVGFGCNKLGQEQIRDGSVDAYVALFEEKYGNYLIPAVIANAFGNEVPSYMFMESKIITRDNIDQYYPQS